MQTLRLQAQPTTPTHAVRELHSTPNRLVRQESAPERYTGNQAALRRLSPFVIQRACACGGGGGGLDEGPCPECQKNHAQTKRLSVSQPGDRFEVEADRAADRVMQTPDSNAFPAPVPVRQRVADGNGGIHTEADDTQSRGEDSAVSSLGENDHADPGDKSDMPLPQEAGHLLDGGVRGFMEDRYGRDFSQVRVHTTAQAADSSRRLGALAYTVGPDIYFNHGRYAPATASGQKLIAHELAHVIQQTGPPGTRQSAQRQIDAGTPSDATPATPSAPSSPKQEKEAPNEEKKVKAMKNCADNYLVESWEGDTCCSNRGFPDPSANNCCNTFPASVDEWASQNGFDGAASCRILKVRGHKVAKYLNHRARVTPGVKSATTVDVLCTDTRDDDEHIIELGPKAAQKAYGRPDVKDPDGRVCISDSAEATTCSFDQKCKPKPKPADCVDPSCSAPAPEPPKKDKSKKPA